MQKSGIEWCDYTSNPVKGYCPMGCSYCYARRIYDRFKWDKTIRFVPKEFEEWGKAKAGSKIFVGSMIELFGKWVNDDWLEEIFKYTKYHPDLTFQFLTKQPQNLIKFSPFPDNCWVGVTATDRDSYNNAVWYLKDVSAKVRFLSFEPLLDNPVAGILDNRHSWPVMYGSILQDVIDWLIIGAQTKPTVMPKLEWVKEIVEAADSAGVPVFLKNNLAPLLSGHPEFWEDIPQGDHPNYESIAELRQEVPK